MQHRLWQSGIFSWDDFLAAEKIWGFSKLRKKAIDEQFWELKQHLKQLNGEYFARRLPFSHHWLLFPEFKSVTAFIDIETSGIGEQAYTTVVGIASLSGYQSLVRGVNLDQLNLQKALAPYKMLVSFYGSGFDLPFLKREFPDLPIYYLPHFDLCLSGRKVGLRGGLKKVEKQLGIIRPPEVCDLGGYEAVMLWEDYLAGNQRALERLLLYNREDTVNLVSLAKIIYQKLSAF